MHMFVRSLGLVCNEVVGSGGFFLFSIIRFYDFYKFHIAKHSSDIKMHRTISTN